MKRNAPTVGKALAIASAAAGLVAVLALLPGCDFGLGPGGTSQGNAPIYHADDSSFDQQVLQSPVPVLVDFYADWCGPCQMLAPILEELARETPSARVVKVNVDHSRQLATRYNITGIPSVMVFRDGKVVGQHMGLADKAQLQAMLSM
jgi:thioredoxin 1